MKMMVCTLALVAAVVALPAEHVQARPRPAGLGKSDFVANKTFGAGFMFGAPFGLSGKYFFGPSSAVDFGIGAVRGFRNRRGYHIHADYLLHPVTLTKQDAFELPLYVGVGARLFDFDDGSFDGATAIGLRAPVGIAIDWNRVPLDVFLELVLVADFYSDYKDSFGVDINGAIGIRYWFK